MKKLMLAGVISLSATTAFAQDSSTDPAPVAAAEVCTVQVTNDSTAPVCQLEARSMAQRAVAKRAMYRVAHEQRVADAIPATSTISLDEIYLAPLPVYNVSMQFSTVTHVGDSSFATMSLQVEESIAVQAAEGRLAWEWIREY